MVPPPFTNEPLNIYSNIPCFPKQPHFITLVTTNNYETAYGYFPKPSKTIVVLKDPGKLEETTGIFGPLGLTVTLDGERHLGAAVGSAVFRNRYVSEKVNLWVQDVEKLADVAI